MEIDKYLDKICEFQEILLSFLDKESNTDVDFIDINEFFNDQYFFDDKLNLEEILYLICNIVNGHKQNSFFFDKIKKILLFLKPSVLKHLDSQQIFDIFKRNKKTLLFILKEHFLEINEHFVSCLIKQIPARQHYLEYFYPDIKNFLSEKVKKDIEEKLKIDDYEDFDKKREIGENDGLIAYYIRNDLIDEFIVLVNKNNISLSSTINDSIFETNKLLASIKTDLIQYASFFGSYKVFKFLFMNNVELDSSLWIYLTHGNNPELIHLLEENHVFPENNNFTICLQTSIIFHQNDIANYIISSYMNEQFVQNNLEINSIVLEHYNFNFFQDNLSNPFILYKLMDFEHLAIVKILFDTKVVDINSILIYSIFF